MGFTADFPEKTWGKMEALRSRIGNGMDPGLFGGVGAVVFTRYKPKSHPEPKKPGEMKKKWRNGVLKFGAQLAGHVPNEASLDANIIFPS